MSNRLYYCEFPIYTRERKARVSGAAATIGNGVKMRNYQMSMGLFWLGLCRARAELDAHNISCIYSSAVSFFISINVSIWIILHGLGVISLYSEN
jgi:hypothetical protein